MGRKSREKKERKLQRVREPWDQFRSSEFLAETRRLIVSSGATPDSCICCTKVLCQLGDSLGLRVEPLVVEAFVYNAPFVEHFAHQGFEINADIMEQIVEQGGRYVVLGSRREEERIPEKGKWGGHLVAVVYPPKGLYERPHVVDLSIDQAHRPQKGIFLQKPLVFPIPSKRFLRGEEDALGLTEADDNKMLVAYKAHPDAEDFKESPDWQRDYEARTHDSIEIEQPKENP